MSNELKRKVRINQNDAAYDPLFDYPVCKSNRGPRGPRGLTSTNDNGLFYYQNENSKNSQFVPFNVDTELQLNVDQINGTSITRSYHKINLTPGVYSVDFSADVKVPYVYLFSVVRINAQVNTDAFNSQAPVNDGTEEYVVFNPDTQHLSIPTIIETDTNTAINATVKFYYDWYPLSTSFAKLNDNLTGMKNLSTSVKNSSSIKEVLDGSNGIAALLNNSIEQTTALGIESTNSHVIELETAYANLLNAIITLKASYTEKSDDVHNTKSSSLNNAIDTSILAVESTAADSDSLTDSFIYQLEVINTVLKVVRLGDFTD